MDEMKNVPAVENPDEINLAQLLIPLVSHWKFVVGIPVIGAILFSLLFYLFAPRSYMSAADFVVMEPRFKTELQESSSNVQYYKTLIESPALLASVQKELIKNGVLGADDRLEIGKQIQDFVFTKKRAEDITLSPIIRLAAYGNTPEDAFRILDTWIRHIEDTVRLLNEKGKNEAISFIDREFPKQKVQYEQASKELEKDKAWFLKSFNQLDQERKMRLDSFDAQTVQMLNEFDAKHQQMRIDLNFRRGQYRRKVETERKQLRNQLISKLTPELVKTEYQKVLKEYSDFRATLKTISIKIGSEREIVKSLLEQEKKIPLVRRLKKKTLFVSSVTEIPNPDYEKVQEKIIEHKLKLSTLEAEKKNILSHLAQLDKQFTDMRSRLNENEKEIHAFDVETENKLNTIDDETAMKLKTFDAETLLARKKLADKRAQKRMERVNHFRETEQILKGKQNVALSIATKQQGYMENVYQMLGQKYEQARLAKAEDEVSLKLATKPFKPVLAQPRGIIKKTVITWGLLLILCGGWVYGRELFLRVRLEMEL
ncbi:MAG: hypothetical protein GXO69_02635 [Acidobacteria bacterium]|nr:hypothetical protein [Acidobacteriota bacterium]